jgi:hypothetical protein
MGGHVNFVSVLTGAVLAWLYGAAYYTALAKPWIEAQGMTVESHKAMMAARSRAGFWGPYAFTLLAELLMGVVIFGILTHSGLWSLRAGIITGAFCWIGFVVTTVSINNAYAGRRFKLSIIDSGHWLGVLIIIGGTIGAWGP